MIPRGPSSTALVGAMLFLLHDNGAPLSTPVTD